MGRVADDVTRVERFACPVTGDCGANGPWDMEWRAARSRGPARISRTWRRARALAIGVTTTLGALYLDLFDGDGSVRHLLRPANQAQPAAEPWSGPPRRRPVPRLIVAFGAATPLELGQRPEIEPAANYLDALRSRIDEAKPPLAADLAMVIVRAAEPAVVKLPQLRPPPVRSQKCANIVSRAQLGETLSDAELAVLRTECRS